MQAMTETGSPAAHAGGWYLEGYLGEEKAARRFGLGRRPIVVGRATEADLVIPVETVSARHAEIRVQGEQVWIRDLGSSNGTFVNRERLRGERRLVEGDIVHFCTAEFVLGRITVHPADALRTTIAAIETHDLPRRFSPGARELRELLRDRTVRPVYQPIVSLDGAKECAYEVLGRGNHPALPVAPEALFRIADAVDLEGHLSAVFREVGLDEGKRLGASTLFFNTHPTELGAGAAARWLRHTREACPGQRLVVELHEGAVANSHEIREFRALLADLDIGLAYDDFGAGQARLVELAEVPPDYIKFDKSMIRDLPQAPSGKRMLIANLVHLAAEMGVRSIAEGVETAAELSLCRELGFDCAQGYHLGRPEPVEHWTRRRRGRLFGWRA